MPAASTWSEATVRARQSVCCRRPPRRQAKVRSSWTDKSQKALVWNEAPSQPPKVRADALDVDEIEVQPEI